MTSDPRLRAATLTAEPPSHPSRGLYNHCAQKLQTKGDFFLDHRVELCTDNFSGFVLSLGTAADLTDYLRLIPTKDLSLYHLISCFCRLSY